MSSDDRIIRQILEIADRTGVGYHEVAAAAGVSPSTTRHSFATGRLPERERPRELLRRFATVPGVLGRIPICMEHAATDPRYATFAQFAGRILTCAALKAEDDTRRSLENAYAERRRGR